MNPKPIVVELDKESLKKQYEQAVREIEELAAKTRVLVKYKDAISELLQSLEPYETRLLEIPRSMLRPAKRAPHGTLKSAILELFAPGHPLSNAEVRDRLIAAAYPYKIEGMNLRKTLDRLAEAGELQSSHKEGRVFFTLSKTGDKTKRN
jgi:hypothetical protein